MEEGTENEFSEIREMLTGLVISQREHGIEQRQLKEDVAQIKHVLIDGNGKPSITVRVALAEQELARVIQERTQERNDRKLPRAAWLGILISTILSLAGIALTIAKMV